MYHLNNSLGLDDMMKINFFLWSLCTKQHLPETRRATKKCLNAYRYEILVLKKWNCNIQRSSLGNIGPPEQ